MTLDALRTQVNTVITATPYVGGAVFLLVATTPLSRAGPITQAVSGAVFGGTIGALVEYTYNRNEHPTDLKWQIIGGNAAIGGVTAGALTLVQRF